MAPFTHAVQKPENWLLDGHQLLSSLYAYLKSLQRNFYKKVNFMFIFAHSRLDMLQ
ncbi:hypothetical protein HMPREF3213_01066 [Heyndrickxia coagulans]|uniref:Uncharacterized protein n=1 Tax=Heyndrickxia coagulans TaxID=1398 RepID=A0A133KX12_HEYCO|nr:hypothetical protein HMPREF3213_01066 [Heyndrickxia coagulans]